MAKPQFVLLNNPSLLWFLINIVAVPVAGISQYYTFGFLDMAIRNISQGAEMFRAGFGSALVGGAIAGVILGSAQSLALLHTAVSKWLWCVSTIAGLLVGNAIISTIWLLGAIYKLPLSPAFFNNPVVEESIFYSLLLILGLVQGAVVGTLQWLVLRQAYEGHKRWIWITSLSWLIWFTLPLIGLSSFDPLIKALISNENIYFYGRFVFASIPYVIVTTLAIKRIMDRASILPDRSMEVQQS